MAFSTPARPSYTILMLFKLLVATDKSLAAYSDSFVRARRV
jgi:hypothetical protein